MVILVSEHTDHLLHKYTSCCHDGERIYTTDTVHACMETVIQPKMFTVDNLFYFVYTNYINFLILCLYICFVFTHTQSVGVEVFTLEQKVFQPLFLPSGAWSIEVTLKAGNGIHAINH